MDVSDASKKRGRQIRLQMGRSPDTRPSANAPAFELVPELSDFVEGMVFGEIWARPYLDLRTRSAVTMTLLAAQGQERQLRLHVGYALNLGWTQQEIAEVFLQMLPYAGLPITLNALRTAAEEFNARSAEGGDQRAEHGL